MFLSTNYLTYTILNWIQNLFDIDKQNKAVAKFAKHGIKRFRVKHGMATSSVVKTL
jgi:hypothetical protein